jgi:hypothetical protein
MCHSFSETVWRFKTANFTVSLEIEHCPLDPTNHFDDGGQAAADIACGAVDWFDALVTVRGTGGELVGSDSLGCCAYAPASDFWTAHRDPDPMNRNCSIRHALSMCGHTTIGHYFPDMIHLAICDARRNLAARRDAYAAIKAA